MPKFLNNEEQDRLVFERSLSKAWSSIDRVWQRTAELKCTVSLNIDSLYLNLHMSVMQVVYFDQRLAKAPQHLAEQCAISADQQNYDISGQAAFTAPN